MIDELDRPINEVLLVVGVSLLLVVSGVNAVQIATSDDSTPFDRFDEAQPGVTKVADQASNTTVITAYGTGGGHLIAINPNGTLKFYSNSYDEYYDVDPIGGETVMVAAMDEMQKSDCPADTACTRQHLLRVNLTNGDSEVLFERFRPGLSNNEWHDIDHLEGDKYVIAGMDRNEVFIINATTGIKTWTWNAQSHYNISTGGSNVFGVPAYPIDWTHLNDVEVLPDGRIMVSMRNHDEVIFLNRTSGVDESWTIGSDDNFSVMYEQHNPDYIPEERGGPAVVIADSQNNRIVEYQRVDGDWEQTWTWSDGPMQWPRDADRLPGGETLISDTNSHRVIEVSENGSVIWSVQNVPGVYEAERLETGDESAGGHSARALNLSGTGTGAVDPDAGSDSLGAKLKSVLPAIVVNSLLYVTPSWWTWTGVDGLLFISGLGFIVTGAALWIRGSGKKIWSKIV